ncbi:MAG: toxin ParE1/3/4 [Phenylobacterium sp.]|jgi:toxin ParE1/3/4
MRTVHLQVKARQDLKDILRYSIGEHGWERAERYYDSLTNGIESLCKNPELGFSRADIKPDYRQLPIEKHHVFYKVTSTQIRVVRILHERALKTKHL